MHRVEQQDWETLNAADWVERLNQEITASDGDVVLVAHSLACPLITRWAEQYPETYKVRGALLVAPSDTEADSYTVNLGVGRFGGAQITFRNSQDQSRSIFNPLRFIDGATVGIGIALPVTVTRGF